MTKVIWRANQVISIETKCKDESRKENIYVLAQMINKAQLLVFNLFNKDNNWEGIDLNKAPILFCTYVTRQFIANSNISKQKIAPLKDYQPPRRLINALSLGVRYVDLWKGTPDERRIMVLGEGGGRLIEGDIGDCIEIIHRIPFTDDETIDKYELTHVRIYPEFNERLYLCYKMGKNVDPMKDLIFNRPIPLEYKDYIDIISPKKSQEGGHDIIPQKDSRKGGHMDLTLRLNARFQPKHRFELEDVLQEILEKERFGEITGGGTAQNSDGEIMYCDIEIHLTNEKPDSVKWLVGLLNSIGIPKGSVLQGIQPEIEVGTLEGLAYYSNGVDLPEEVYKTCDINYVIEQMELAMEGIGRMYSYWEGATHTALYFYGSSFSEMKKKIEPIIAAYPLCRKSRIEQIA